MIINPELAKYYYFESITSTNDFAKELLSNDELIIVSALHQTKGRGRNTNQWYGSYGNNLYLSIGIKHNSAVSSLTLAVLQAVGSLAVYNTLVEITNQDIFRIKYPNDVYAKHNGKFKKISGILIEHSFAGSECFSSVIGIGLNAKENSFPEELKETATSLLYLGVNIEINQIQEKILNNFFTSINNYKEIELYENWKNKLNLSNKTITVIGKKNKFRLSKFFEDGRIELIDENNNKITIDNGDSIRYNLD